jgi:hypothetical protein
MSVDGKGERVRPTPDGEVREPLHGVLRLSTVALDAHGRLHDA